MAIQGIPSAGLNQISGSGPAKAGGFSAALKAATPAKASQVAPAAKPQSAHAAMAAKIQGAQPQAKPVNGTAPGKVAAPQAVDAKAAAQVLDRISAAQKQMDQVLKLAQSGKSFTPAELLALQAQVYGASQQLDLAGKVVEKATGGVKQVLQTQV